MESRFVHGLGRESAGVAAATLRRIAVIAAA
jgi:hypothetical protein